MEIDASLTEVIVNILVQLINIGLFFFLVVKYMAKPITQAIETRIEKEKRLARADETYKEVISEAKKQAEDIVARAADHKRRVVEEAVDIAQKKTDELLADAERKASDIKAQASIRSDELRRELEEHFTDSVKHTSALVVSKLLGTKKNVKDAYLTTIVEELTHENFRHETHK